MKDLYFGIDIDNVDTVEEGIDFCAEAYIARSTGTSEYKFREGINEDY